MSSAYPFGSTCHRRRSRSFRCHCYRRLKGTNVFGEYFGTRARNDSTTSHSCSAGRGSAISTTPWTRQSAKGTSDSVRRTIWAISPVQEALSNRSVCNTVRLSSSVCAIESRAFITQQGLLKACRIHFEASSWLADVEFCLANKRSVSGFTISTFTSLRTCLVELHTRTYYWPGFSTTIDLHGINVF